MKAINNLEYQKIFQTKKEAALKTALDIRKFEIEMYWKRATYFWAFITTTFAGYFVLLSSKNINDYRGLTIVISSIGFFFSLGWYFVNRASKFWQENWEAHVSMLEDNVHGPLFSVIRIPKDKIKELNGHYPFSVSKINQLLSSIVVAFWFCIFIFSIFYSFNCLYYLGNLKLWIIFSISVILMALLICFSYIFYKESFSFLLKPEYKNIPKKEDDLFYLNKDIQTEKITMGNDEFILYIRKQHINCQINTKELGRLIWEWIIENDSNAKQVQEDMHCLWETKDGALNINKNKLPKTATQFKFNRNLLPELYDYLDKLGQQ